ncbi:MAG: hypothetical protein RIT27_273 [Pseudomonadota bacterium]|jgi:Zn-dependent protease with chaperone function
MQSEKVEQFVEQLTQFAEKNPQAYRLKVLALAVLGYAYIAFVLFVILGISSALTFVLLENHLSFVAAKIILVVGGLLFIVLRALWIRLSPPQGTILTREQVPRLFEILEDIRQKLQAPKIHQVLLTEDFNAAIVQHPRLGILGWQKNYLILGLPLLQALSLEQLTAVLAHEYGHLSGAHGRWGAWIYRIRQTWQRLNQGLQDNKSWGNVLFYRFFNWYVPFFHIYSFVLARQEEFEADRCAAQISGSTHAAQALVSVSLKGRFLAERFWQKLYKLADNTAEPLHEPYRLLQKILPFSYDKALTPEEKQKWLKDALALRTDVDDTHPSLSDRLAALKETAQLPLPILNNAATYCFGENLDDYLEQFSSQWKILIEEQWEARFNYVQKSKEFLKSLIDKSKITSLTVEECWQRAELVREFYGNDQALPFYQLILKKQPTHAAAHFVIGSIYSEKRLSHAPMFLKKAMEYDAHFIIAACEELYKYYQQVGQFDTAKFYLERAQARQQEEQFAVLERDSLNYKDNFIEHGLIQYNNLAKDETEEEVNLDSGIIDHLIEQLQEDKTIKRLYLVRKDLQYLPEKPLYVLGIVRTVGLRNKSDNTQYVKNLAKIIQLPIELLIVVIDDYPKLSRKIKKVPHALIYQKSIGWWAKWWKFWTLFLLVILLILFALQNEEETPHEISKPIITKTISNISLPTQDNALTLAQQSAQFQLKQTLSYDKRLVEGLKLAFETYLPLLVDMPAPQVKTTIKQLDETRFEILYQISMANQPPIEYYVILSNQPEQVLNNFQAILTTFAQFKTIFQPQRFPQTQNEATLKQLNTEIFQFDTLAYFKKLHDIDTWIFNHKENPLILLSASEMLSWLSFFNNHQRNTTLADKLAIQSLVYLLMGDDFSNESFYQKGLLLLALDYPNSAVQLFDKKPAHTLSQLLSAFIHHDDEFLRDISEEKATFHQISWYLLMRLYQNDQQVGWSSFFMRRMVEKYPSFIAGKGYVAAQGQIELSRVLSYPYLVDIFVQHLKIAATFFDFNLSEKQLHLIQNPHDKIETADWTLFYNQLLNTNYTLKTPQTTLLTATLLRELLTEEVLNALIISYELAADHLVDLERAENVLTAIEAIFDKTPTFRALKIRQQIKRQKPNYSIPFSSHENDLFLLSTLLSSYTMQLSNLQQRPEIITLYDRYRELQNPNARGYIQLAKLSKRLYYLPQAQIYLQKASKLSSFQKQVALPEIKLSIPVEIENRIQQGETNAVLAYSLNAQSDKLLTLEQLCAVDVYLAALKTKQHQYNEAINYLLMSLETNAVSQPEYEMALQWLIQLQPFSK